MGAGRNRGGAFCGGALAVYAVAGRFAATYAVVDTVLAGQDNVGGVGVGVFWGIWVYLGL